jgi:hypothetical protein
VGGIGTNDQRGDYRSPTDISVFVIARLVRAIHPLAGVDVWITRTSRVMTWWVVQSLSNSIVILGLDPRTLHLTNVWQV